MRSMTGFGRGDCTAGGRRYVVEVRGVNHRFLDVHVRLPAVLAALESDIRREVAKAVERGRVEASVDVRAHGTAETGVFVDVERARGYHEALKELAAALDIPWRPDAWSLAALPGVIVPETQGLEPEEAWPPVQQALSAALEAFLGMRAEEGRRLASDMAARMESLAARLDVVEARVPAALEAAQQRLRERLAAWLGETPLDEQRLAMEIVLLVDRADVSEEIVRLRSHLSQMRACLQSDGPVGRKLEFLIQECHREVNTLGSKALDVEIASHVIAMKGDIERLREQVQNVE